MTFRSNLYNLAYAIIMTIYQYNEIFQLPTGDLDVPKNL